MVKMTGRLGELLVEQQLLERGWYPVRLDTAQMAANADIVALNRERRISLQVKTTDAKTGHSHSNSVASATRPLIFEKENPSSIRNRVRLWPMSWSELSTTPKILDSS